MKYSSYMAAERGDPDPTITCPGCGLVLPDLGLAPAGGFNVSGECRQLSDELAQYTLTHRGPSFIHQHFVDAYGASHVGNVSKPIMGVFSLAGLYLFLEKGYTGREVQLAHMRMAGGKKDWPRFNPPTRRSPLTIANVLNADEGPSRDEALANWCRSVWQSWSADHSQITQLVEARLYPR